MEFIVKDQKKVKDIFIKLHNIYKTGCYITSDGYIMRVNDSPTDKDRIGHFICKLNDKYMDLLSDLFLDTDMIRITSLKSIKESLMTDTELKKKIKEDLQEEDEQLYDKLIEEKGLDEYILNEISSIRNNKNPIDYIQIVQPNDKAKALKRLELFLSYRDRIDNWNMLSEDVVNTLYDEYDYYDLDLGNDKFVVISKALFPIVTKKTASSLKYGNIQLNDELNLVVFDFDFTIMNMLMMFYSV